ncbi:MAG: phage tail sheath subtilisin-like domain-containing protein [Acidobacteria bacterium]|nr:phage tail sheath subtilisin-like domain-containing protein [Acidobacteriota bacterium]
MPVTPTYPGVYIEEIPSGVRPITGVATSIGAFIDFFKRGLLNQAVQILSPSDFEKQFGGLDTRSQASYAIQQFLLNGGTQAWVVRVGGANIQTAAVELLDKPGGSGIVTVTAGQRIRKIKADNPGAWGNNLRLEVDYNTADPGELWNLFVSEIDPASGKVLQSESFRNLTLRPDSPTNALEVVNEGSQLIQLTVVGSVPSPFVTTFRPATTGTLGASPTAIPAENDAFTVDAGSGAKAVTMKYGGVTIAAGDYPTLRPYLEAAIRAADIDDPRLSGASVQLFGTGSSAAPYQFRVLAGRGGASFDPNTELTFAGAKAGDLGLTSTPNVQQYSLGISTAKGAQAVVTNGVGKDGDLPKANDIRGVEASKTGIWALESADLFNILCIPYAAELGATDLQAVASDAVAYCRRRRAFYILDIPSSVQTVTAMQTWMTQNDTLRDSHAAVYFPRVLVPDPLNNNRLRNMAASGTVAGIYAQTDANRGVWKAPAGVETRLRNVSQLACDLTDGENGVLNPVGINCLRNFPVYGNICWGARTLDGADQQASQWKYIPVLRLAKYLEESLYRGTKWVVFEPNDEPLWAQIRLNVGAFMHSLFRQGAFQGSSPGEAYLVRCDAETNPQIDIDRGIVNILVGFAPLKPAEFVIIQIQQLAGQTAQ